MMNPNMPDLLFTVNGRVLGELSCATSRPSSVAPDDRVEHREEPVQEHQGTRYFA